jgi:multiple sugar transport system permease protein
VAWRPARRSLARSRTLKGIGYATPTAVIVGVFFLLPLALVFWMSGNRLPLLG